MFLLSNDIEVLGKMEFWNIRVYDFYGVSHFDSEKDCSNVPAMQENLG